MEINKSIVEAKQDEIRSRLEDYIDFDEVVSPTEFAGMVNIDPSGLIKMLKGQMKITISTLKKISEATGLRLEWLILGIEPQCAPKPEISYTDGVPYYDEIFECGFEELTAPSSESPDFLIRMPGYEKATLWCNASGQSMEPEISNGDIIALRRIEDISFLPYGDIYGIITTNGMRTIKRLGKSSDPSCYRLIPTNKEYDEQDIPKDKILIVYRVMGAMKAF